MKHANMNPSAEPSAQLLALLVSADGCFDDSALRRLDELRAFDQLGVRRAHFVRLVRDSLRHDPSPHADDLWLRSSEWAHVEQLMAGITDPAERLQLCRLAAAVIPADGRITGDERTVYRHMLARWGIDDRMVAQAILHDSHRAGGSRAALRRRG